MKNIKFYLNLFICTLFLIQISLFSQVKKYWPKRQFPHIIAENKLWIGTPNGLYQYHMEEDSWSIYAEHTGLLGHDIQLLQYDGEFLWVVTPEGLSYGDIQLNKWLTFNTDNGLASNTINSIAFQGDYVWVATDSGAARYDKLIEEWELFSEKDGLKSPLVYDVVTDGDLVYFATDKGLTEYEINFEKWRYYGKNEGILSDTIRFIYPTTEFLWLFTDQGPCRFNKRLHTSISFSNDRRLFFDNIIDLVANNQEFWLASDAGLIIYDPASNVWRDFLEMVNLPSPVVHALFISQSNYWFATTNGIAQFENSTKTWLRYDQAQGLSAIKYESIAVNRGLVFLVNQNVIDYYKPVENRWYNYTLKELAGLEGKSKSFLSMDREKGSFYQFDESTRLSISGSRYTFRNIYEQLYYLDSQESLFSQKTVNRGDLKGQLSFPGGRTINGFYNNSDFDQVLYGLRYKGNKGDIVQEANWGDTRYEQGKTQLLPSIGVFGLSGRMEAGPKTERYKRSLFSASGWSGEKTSGRESDFFTGNLTTSQFKIVDIFYQKNRFFDIDTTGYLLPVEQSSEQIFIDDGDPSNNTANTKKDFAIAGCVGDFDELNPYIDYSLNSELGILQLNQPVDTSATIIATGMAKNGLFEIILRKPGSINSELLNTYFVGGMDIIPSSFQMSIYDSLGHGFSLAEFGLDQDMDGQVDAEYMNYKDGFLSFPVKRPFPEIVYDKKNPVSVYQFQISFESEIASFQLSHRELVRGSETVVVDGDILTAGKDYVLDYSGGILLIIREGLVDEDTEIQVDYDYYRDTRETFHQAGVGFAPSDNFEMRADYFAFDEYESKTFERVNGFRVYSEMKKAIKGIDFKLTPEFARTLENEQSGNSMHMRADASSKLFRLFSLYEFYDKEFKTLHPKKFKLGSLYDKTDVGLTIYPVEFIDLSAAWNKQRSQTDDYGNRETEENKSAKVLLSKNLYPALSFSLRQQNLQAELFDADKKTAKADFEYAMPHHLLSKMRMNSLRLYGVWRLSWEDKKLKDHNSEKSKKLYDYRYVRFDFSPVNLVNINAYFRNRSVRNRGVEFDQSLPVINARQKLFLDATIDRITGLNMNLRYQGEVFDYFPSASNAMHNISMYRNVQTTIRFFPGSWIRFFSPVTFEFNLQPTWRGYYRNMTQDFNFSEKYIHTSRERETLSSEDVNLTQLRFEWRPFSFMTYFLTYKDYHIKAQNWSSLFFTNVHQWNQKVELKPSMNSIVTVQYFRSMDEQLDYSRSSRDNPMIWVEIRWTDRLQTKLNLFYQREQKDIGLIRETKSNFSPLIGLTYRFRNRETGITRAEIRNDFSYSFYRSEKSDAILSSRTFSNAFSIDIYPLSVLIMRLRLVTTYKDIYFSDEDWINNLFEIRLTGQF